MTDQPTDQEWRVFESLVHQYMGIYKRLVETVPDSEVHQRNLAFMTGIRDRFRGGERSPELYAAIMDGPPARTAVIQRFDNEVFYRLYEAAEDRARARLDAQEEFNERLRAIEEDYEMSLQDAGIGDEATLACLKAFYATKPTPDAAYHCIKFAGNGQTKRFVLNPPARPGSRVMLMDNWLSPYWGDKPTKILDIVCELWSDGSGIAFPNPLLMDAEITVWYWLAEGAL